MVSLGHRRQVVLHFLSLILIPKCNSNLAGELKSFYTKVTKRELQLSHRFAFSNKRAYF